MALVVVGAAAAFLAPRLGEADDALQAAGGIAWEFVAVGIALQSLAILSQALLVRALLPPETRPPVGLTTRIELAGTALSHTVPGGTVAGTALTFHLLRQNGAGGADAGFAVGVRGFGSALVLNTLLLIALIAAVPLHGFDSLFSLVAIAGAVVVGAVGVQIYLVISRRRRTGGWLQRLLRWLPWIEDEDVESALDRLAERSRAVFLDRRRLMIAIGWSAAYWIFGAASLWVFLAAFGDAVRVDEMMIAFGLANVASFIPVTPRGLGIVEVTLVSVLGGFGVGGGQAALGVLAWRLASFWLPIPAGGLAYLSLRVDASSESPTASSSSDG